MYNEYINKLKGNCSVLSTPLNQCETLDKEGFRNIVDYQTDANINSIFICGGDGEGPSLSDKVKGEALSIALENFEEKPILVGIFESGTKKTVDAMNYLSNVISSNKNVFFVVAPPIYYSPSHSKDEIIDFYKSVNYVGLPIILYSNPKYTGLTFNLEQIQKLSKEENIIGMKFTKDTMKNLKKIIRDTDNKQFKIGFGMRGPLVEAFDIGVDTLINTTAEIIPKTFSDLYLHYENGEIEKAKSLEREIVSFYEIYKIGPDMRSIAKTAVSMLVGCKNYMSSPIRLPKEEEKEKIKEFLQRKNLI